VTSLLFQCDCMLHHEAHFRCVDIHTKTIFHYILYPVYCCTGGSFFSRIENISPIRRWNCDLEEIKL